MCWTFKKMMAKLGLHHVAASLTYVSLPLFLAKSESIVNGVELKTAVDRATRCSRPIPGDFGHAGHR
jgi:hypothetical protein